MQSNSNAFHRFHRHAGAWLGLIGSLVLFNSVGSAQLVVSASDLPNRVGAYYRAYVTAGETDVSSRIGSAGGPRRWDFSEARRTIESIEKTEVVLPADGGHGASFAGAAYAERTTREVDGSLSWSYYRIVPALGRSYYGFYDAVANPTKPATVFNAPTTDLPARIQYGQTWNRTVDWEDVLDVGFLQLNTSVHFTSSAEVDAYGTLVLPGIGEVQALRVNEVNSYAVTDKTMGLPLDTQYFRNYYWLVPGVGKAVHLISNAGTSVPAANFGSAKTMLRVFEASEVKPPATSHSVSGLRITRQGGQVALAWEGEANLTGYRVESATDPFATAWTSLAEPATNGWVSATGDPQRYFRVFTRP